LAAPNEPFYFFSFFFHSRNADEPLRASGVGQGFDDDLPLVVGRQAGSGDRRAFAFGVELPLDDPELAPDGQRTKEGGRMYPAFIFRSSFISASLPPSKTVRRRLRSSTLVHCSTFIVVWKVRAVHLPRRVRVSGGGNLPWTRGR